MKEKTMQNFFINETPVSKRIGVAKGKFCVYGDFEEDGAEIAKLLTEVRCESSARHTFRNQGHE